MAQTIRISVEIVANGSDNMHFSCNSIYSGLMPILSYCHEPNHHGRPSWFVNHGSRPPRSTIPVDRLGLTSPLAPFSTFDARYTNLIISKVGFAGCELACEVLLDAKFLNVNLERTQIRGQDIWLCVENHSIKLHFF